MDRIKTMETFVRIAKAGSLAKAADQLGVSRALVTKHLQQAERHLGARLFNRTTRQLALTETGKHYLAFCTRILAQIEQEERGIAQDQAAIRGNLKILCPIAFGNLEVAPLLARFILAHREIRVNLVLSDAAMNSVELTDNGFDLAIRLNKVEDSGAIAKKIGEVSSVVCASPGYLAAAGRPSSPADLARHNCLVHRKITPDGVWRFGGPGGPMEVRVSGSLVANSVGAIRAAILADVGVGLVPTYGIGPDLAAGTVEAILSEYPLPARPISVVYAYDAYIPQRVRTFVDYLSAALARSGLHRVPAVAMSAGPMSREAAAAV